MKVREVSFFPWKHQLAGEHSVSVMKPYGVWAVISPFNFPLALAAGMCTGALLTGNTVVFKPTSEAPLSGIKLYKSFISGGVPGGGPEPGHRSRGTVWKNGCLARGYRRDRVHRFKKHRYVALERIRSGTAVPKTPCY